MKRIMSLLLSVSLSLPALAAEPLATSAQLDLFIKKYSNSIYAYQLTEDDLQKVFTEGGVEIAYLTQLQQAIEMAADASTSKEKVAKAKALHEMKLEASAIVDQMFRQESIEQMNLDLLKILHRYLFDENSRGPLSHILYAIEQYNFSPEQMRQLEKKASYLKQYTDGALVSFAVITLAAVANFKVHGQSLYKYILQSLKKEAPATTKVTAAEQAKNASSEVNNIDQMIIDLEKMGGAGIAKTTSNKSVDVNTEAIKAVSQVSKMKFFNLLNQLRRHITFKNFAYITGATIVGGGTNIGWKALQRIYFPDDISDSYANPEPLRTDYYDGLATLRLTCRSFDLNEKAKTLNAKQSDFNTELFNATKNLNSLYVELTILQRLAKRYNEKVTLPQAVQVNPSTGIVTANIQIKDKVHKEQFECLKLKTSISSASSLIEVNLNEALYYIKETFQNLNNLDSSEISVELLDENLVGE
jgi:hypothetical protein